MIKTALGLLFISIIGKADISPAPTTLGYTLGKTTVLKTGSLVSSATTADQVVLTYTVTTGKTFYLNYWTVSSRLTTVALTATNFGTCSLENPSGTKLWTELFYDDGSTSRVPSPNLIEPIPISSATVIRIVCTPAAATSTTWQANLGGYEK